jgi:pimeloyl-ACP methyl ester carboxylesterase
MGAPVVLIHGWGGSFQHTWAGNGLVELLADEGRRVIPVDLRGHGDAAKPHDPEAYADMTDEVLDVLPALGPVDAVGFSLGAMTLLHLACRQPERFGRIVLAGIGNGAFAGGTGFGRKAAEALEGKGDPDDRTTQALAEYGRREGNDLVALAAIMRRPMPADPITKERVAAITSKVLVCIGDADFAAPADELAAAFQHGTLKEFRKTDHFATPESFNFVDAVLRFLA